MAEKWISCKACGHTYSNKIRHCPECGQRSPIGLKQILLFVLIFGVMGFACVGFVLGLGDKSENIKSASKNSSIAESQNSSTSTLPSEAQSVCDNSSKVVSNYKNDTSTNTENKEKIESSSKVETSSSENIEVIIPQKPAEEDKLKNTTVTTEKLAENVKVTLSAEWIELIEEVIQTPFSTEITEADRKYGITSIFKNNDDSVTAIFTNDGFLIYKSDLLAEVIKTIQSAENKEKFPYIKKVGCTNSYDKVLIAVSGKEFDSQNNSVELEEVMWEIGLTTYLYKVFIGESNPEVKISASLFETHEEFAYLQIPN